MLITFIVPIIADAKYKTVSAASIIAKVTRDTLLRKWQWQECGLALDKEFGSGYPGDEHCVHWYGSPFISLALSFSIELYPIG